MFQKSVNNKGTQKIRPAKLLIVIVVIRKLFFLTLTKVLGVEGGQMTTLTVIPDVFERF